MPSAVPMSFSKCARAALSRALRESFFISSPTNWSIVFRSSSSSLDGSGYRSQTTHTSCCFLLVELVHLRPLEVGSELVREHLAELLPSIEVARDQFRVGGCAGLVLGGRPVPRTHESLGKLEVLGEVDLGAVVVVVGGPRGARGARGHEVFDLHRALAE